MSTVLVPDWYQSLWDIGVTLLITGAFWFVLAALSDVVRHIGRIILTIILVVLCLVLINLYPDQMLAWILRTAAILVVVWARARAVGLVFAEVGAILAIFIPAANFLFWFVGMVFSSDGALTNPQAVTAAVLALVVLGAIIYLWGLLIRWLNRRLLRKDT